jgi:hypothetical protein
VTGDGSAWMAEPLDRRGLLNCVFKEDLCFAIEVKKARKNSKKGEGLSKLNAQASRTSSAQLGDDGSVNKRAQLRRAHRRLIVTIKMI